MRILQVSSAQYLGGGERYLADLANSFATRGHEVYAILRPGSPLVAQLTHLQKQNISELPLRNSLDALSAQRLAAFVRKHEVEIVHAHMARDYPLAAYAAASNPTARLIVTRHVLFPLNRLHKLTLLRVARVIAVSNAVALQLRAERIVPRERIAVIPNGVDIARFDDAIAGFSRTQFLNDWNLPADCLLVGTVGEIKALKGQEEFLQAAARIAEDFPNAFFIVAGIDSSKNQQNRAALEVMVDQLGLRERVRFIDWLEKIGQLYCALDVFVSASRAESFGLAIAEAMACRAAVVATMTEGAQEIVEPGQSGLLVPVGNANAIADAVLTLLRDPSERARLAEKAGVRVRTDFSLDRMVSATEKLYRESLARS